MPLTNAQMLWRRAARGIHSQGGADEPALQRLREDAAAEGVLMMRSAYSDLAWKDVWEALLPVGEREGHSQAQAQAQTQGQGQGQGRGRSQTQSAPGSSAPTPVQRRHTTHQSQQPYSRPTKEDEFRDMLQYYTSGLSGDGTSVLPGIDLRDLVSEDRARRPLPHPLANKKEKKRHAWHGAGIGKLYHP